MLISQNIINFFDKQVLELCNKELSLDRKLAVAVSGGADSVFVLLAFVDMFKAENLVVFHFNHKLRANADIEEVFVRDLCDKLGAKCIVGKPLKKIEKHSEEAYRQARMVFFKDSAIKANLNVIAQGHHLGDVSETILMRLMRGASPEGLVAPRNISKLPDITFIRPFLSLKKQEIIEELKLQNQAWCEDESNATNDYLRNKVRNVILPKIREICDRDFDAMALLSKTLIAEQEEFFQDYTSELYSKSRLCENSIMLRATHKALLRALVTKFLYEKNIDFTFKALNDFLDKVKLNLAVKLSTKNGFLEFKDNILSYVEKEEPFAEFCVELKMGENLLPDGSVLKLEKLFLGDDAISFVKENSDVESKVYVDFESAKFPLYARNRRQGDSIEYMGLKKAKKVQDIFVDKKVPRQMRDKIALIADSSGSLLWVAFAPPSKNLLVRANSDVLLLTYTRK
ncbi:MAG: tRNA lysidine(34) synthetase TilS [Opitutales bacterium]